MQYETITMPDAGIGSFLTSNLDEIDDNILMFGNAGGINSMKEVADRMAKMGREGDTFVVHASEKEVMVPREVAENNPELVGQIKEAIAAEGADPEAYVVGSDRNSINPMTGQREFFLKKLVKGIKKVFKKAAKIILPVAINYFLPGLGTIASGAIGAGIGGLIQGESFGDALKSAALGGITAGVASGISGAISGEGFMAGLKGGLPASYSGSGLEGALPSFAKGDFDFRDFGAGQGKLFGTGFRGTKKFTEMFPVPEAVQPLTSAGTAEKVSEIMANNPNISDKVALDIVQGNAAAAGGSSVLGTAVKYGLPTLLAAGSMGAFDPIPATEVEIEGFDPGDTSETRVADNPEKYTVGQPINTSYITPTQAIYSGQPLTTAAYLPSQGTYNPIVPSATYSNIIPTGAGTAPITPSGSSSSSPEVAEAQLAGYDPRVTGMRPAPIYGVDAQGNPIMTPYVEPIMPARFVGSNQEVQMAASGGAMNFPRRMGQIEGPGTETSDDIPAMLSDGEFVMTAKAVKGAGNGSREQGFRKMYDIMRSFEGGAVA